MKKGCEGVKPNKKRSIELPVLASGGAGEGIVRESKTAYWRAFALITLNLLMIAHIVQWYLTGRTVSPIEPSEAMYTLQRGALNAGFIFFTLAILATLIFGRFVCGWGCHVVALQDLCGWLLKKMGLKPRPFRSRLLVWVPLIFALYMFVWPTVYRAIVAAPNEPLIPQFTNHLVVDDFWATFPPIAVAIPFLLVCGFMTVIFLGQKGFCTYACPYGGFFSLADKVAPGKIRVTDACNQCGHCTAVCTSNVLVHAEVKEYGAVVDPGCMKCMDCVSVCPNDALYFGFGKPSLAVSKSLKQNHSLTWPEELVAAAAFGFSLFAVWDVYQLVPMLMALGVAVVTTFLVVRTIRLFRSGDLAFYRFALKSSGKIKTAGWVFLAFSAFWIGLNAHSGYVRYHERAGAQAYESIRIPDELALARPNPDPWLGASDRKNITDGRKHLNAAASAGLFTNAFALPKLAWMEYLAGNTDRSLELLAKSATLQTGQARALNLYYRGAILNRTGSSDRALADLDAALAERPDLIVAREERGEALWQLGRRSEAVTVWKDALGRNPDLVLANLFLAGANAADGNQHDADAYERQGDRLTPADPFFNWMLGLRLQNVGMNQLADKYFKRAIQINPEFRVKRTFDPRPQ
ncbi:MAG: 4Fe-4S binding protein [Acidobacteria bacterium]|nr:4Fe-4S binding protein [Acidobacteriota bacterium]